MAVGTSVSKNVTPCMPVTDAACITVKKLHCVYAILIMVPSLEKRKDRYSTDVINTGKAKTVHQPAYFNIIRLAAMASSANTSGNNNVKAIAIGAGITLNK